MWEAQEWGGMYQRYKNINLKIQRSNERVSQDKESIERHNDSLQNKRSTNSLHSPAVGVLGSLNVNRAAKKPCWLTKYLERHLKDKSFENITLCLDQQPLKIQFTKEKRTLKTLVLSPEAYSYLNRAVKNKLVLTKIWA